METVLAQLTPHHAELALRVLVAVVLGSLVGWEQSAVDRNFGL